MKTSSFSKSNIVTESTRKIGDVLKQDDSKNNIKKETSAQLRRKGSMCTKHHSNGNGDVAHH